MRPEERTPVDPALYELSKDEYETTLAAAMRTGERERVLQLATRLTWGKACRYGTRWADRAELYSEAMLKLVIATRRHDTTARPNPVGWLVIVIRNAMFGRLREWRIRKRYFKLSTDFARDGEDTGPVAMAAKTTDCNADWRDESEALAFDEIDAQILDGIQQGFGVCEIAKRVRVNAEDLVSRRRAIGNRICRRYGLNLQCEPTAYEFRALARKHTSRGVAKILGVTPDTVRAALRGSGLKTQPLLKRPAQPTKQTLEKQSKLEQVRTLAGSHTADEIAKLVGVTYRTAFSYLKEIDPNYRLRKNAQRKLTPRQVRQIRDSFSAESNCAVAKRFGVSEGTVRLIRQNKTWVSPN